jgi:hypothetical protein
LLARFGANPLYTRQSFEHALDALLTPFSSDPLVADNFKSDGLQHE